MKAWLALLLLFLACPQLKAQDKYLVAIRFFEKGVSESENHSVAYFLIDSVEENVRPGNNEPTGNITSIVHYKYATRVFDPASLFRQDFYAYCCRNPSDVKINMDEVFENGGRQMWLWKKRSHIQIRMVKINASSICHCTNNTRLFSDAGSDEKIIALQQFKQDSDITDDEFFQLRMFFSAFYANE